MKKRVLSVFVAALVVCWLLPLPAVAQAAAKPSMAMAVSSTVAYNTVVSHLNSLITQYVNTTYTGTEECKGFAKMIFRELFGVQNIGATLTAATDLAKEYSSQFYYGMIKDPAGAAQIGQSAIPIVYETVVAQLKNARPGDFLQARVKNGSYGHSMIVVKVDSDGVWVFDCNSDNKLTIKKRYLFYSDIVETYSFFTVYTAIGYEGTAPVYTIRFNSNGGTSVSNQAVKEGNRIASPTNPVKSGYWFCGWFRDVACTTAWNFAFDKVSGNMTLYAKWTNQRVTVTFRPQGGCSVAAVLAPCGGLVPKPANPTRAGYVFCGWYKETTCTTAWNFSFDRVSQNTTLYACWISSNVPAVPSSVKAASATYTSLKLSWTGSSIATGYMIYRYNAGTGVYSYLASTLNPYYTDIGLTTGTKYSYKIRSYRVMSASASLRTSSGTLYSSYSAVASAAPAPASVTYTVDVGSANPFLRSLTIGKGTAVNIRFTAPVDGTYILESIGSLDTEGFLYDPEGRLFGYSNNTVGVNFRMIAALAAGKQYRLYIRGYQNKTGGTFTLKITRPSDLLPPGKPNPISPGNGSSFTMPNNPTLVWSAISAPSGSTVKYYVETFDCAEPQNSGWITGTSWRPTTTCGGAFNWHVKAIDTLTGKESGYGAVWRYTMNEPAKPGTPSLISPASGTSFVSSAPTLYWGTVASPTGGQIKYFAEIFDSPVYQCSDWTTSTSWRPSVADGKPGLYNWHVKSIDLATGKESGWGPVWQFTINKGESTDLRLDIRLAMYGINSTFVDVTSKVRTYIVNDESISVTVSNDLCGYDPVPNVKKQLVVTYRNRWNQEYRVTVAEGDTLSLTRDSTVGTYLLDGDG